jgi:hypothetical protein
MRDESGGTGKKPTSIGWNLAWGRIVIECKKLTNQGCKNPIALSIFQTDASKEERK